MYIKSKMKNEIVYQINKLCQVQTKANRDDLRVIADGPNQSIVVT